MSQVRIERLEKVMFKMGFQLPTMIDPWLL